MSDDQEIEVRLTPARSGRMSASFVDLIEKYGASPRLLRRARETVYERTTPTADEAPAGELIPGEAKTRADAQARDVPDMAMEQPINVPRRIMPSVGRHASEATQEVAMAELREAQKLLRDASPEYEPVEWDPDYEPTEIDLSSDDDITTERTGRLRYVPPPLLSPVEDGSNVNPHEMTIVFQWVVERLEAGLGNEHPDTVQARSVLAAWRSQEVERR